LPQATKTETDTTIAPAEVKNEPEVPAATEPLNAEAVGAHLVEFSAEATPAEVTPAEAAVPEPVVYQTEAAAAQEPAPIDREDEPTFASAASVISEVQPEAESAAISEPSAPVVEPPAVELTNADSMTETAIQAEEPKVEEAARAEGTSKPDAERPPKTTGPEAASPSAEELVEALRFLTPSQSITPPTLAEAGAALADELSRGSGSRWIAEATPLSPEEAAGSLETEMFRTFAPSASEPTPPPDELTTSVGATEPPIAPSETAAQINTAAASVHVEDAPASPTAAATDRVALQQKESSAGQTEEVPEEPVAATTFADGIRSQEVESVSATAETVTTAEMDMQTQEKLSSLENGSGGEEAMGNETKGKGGKSTWRQIRSGPPTAASDAVEAAKQSEESPKTMAAAAADNGSDASSIASIVDSVLADLRPKIVEEIAKQLAKK
jgi:hypothetical protein